MCQVRLEKKEEFILATLKGEFILGCTSEIKEKVKDYAENNHLYNMIIDLSDVSFVDSSGLGAMIAWFKMANQQQSKVVFCNLTAHVRKVIGFAKLDKIFVLADTMEEAEAALKENA